MAVFHIFDFRQIWQARALEIPPKFVISCCVLLCRNPATSNYQWLGVGPESNPTAKGGGKGRGDIWLFLLTKLESDLNRCIEKL